MDTSTLFWAMPGEKSAMLDTQSYANPVSDVLGTVGIAFSELARHCSQIILFGSRAAGCAHGKSDWDILVVGEGPTCITKHIDLVWVHPRDLDSGAFFSRELTGHVARYGVWLHGSPDWRAAVCVGSAAVEHKAMRLASRVHALERAWPILNAQLRTEEATLVRRDLQRFALLSCGEPIPPSRCLDDGWQVLKNKQEQLVAWTQAANVRADFMLHVLDK